MKILANKEIKRFIGAVAAVLAAFFLLSMIWVRRYCRELTAPLLIGFLLLAIGVLAVCFLYFTKVVIIIGILSIFLMFFSIYERNFLV